MHLEWIVSPVTQGALVAAGLSFALYLFCTLKIEIRSVERRARPQPARAEIAELRGRLEELAVLQRESQEQNQRVEAPAVAVRPALNLSLRNQALRLHRRGETPQQIAQSLGIPTGEVQLLLKVHRILIDLALAPSPAGALKPGPHSADMNYEKREDAGG